MNQDQVKNALVSLRATKIDFTLIFSGKKSSRVNGLYKPATKEIVIHNRNFSSDNDLLFTALHEYAHHLNCTEYEGASPRAHTIKFWSILHGLLSCAEASGLYRNPAKEPEFDDTTEALQKLIADSGRIMREIGRLLVEAAALCEKQGARFDDYVMRVLKQTMPWARACMAAAGERIPEDLGAENIKTVAAIKNEDEREAAIDALRSDMSPQQVKVAMRASKEPGDVFERLEKERERITHTIESLAARAKEIEKQLKELKAAA
ncbi:MAG: hypothetical protein JNG85_11830 [Spirochaetaceae bacterium]|nr:hypothetical protein [Spirochaetaceae bacterium]